MHDAGACGVTEQHPRQAAAAMQILMVGWCGDEGEMTESGPSLQLLWSVPLFVVTYNQAWIAVIWVRVPTLDASESSQAGQLHHPPMPCGAHVAMHAFAPPQHQKHCLPARSIGQAATASTRHSHSLEPFPLHCDAHSHSVPHSLTHSLHDLEYD